MNRKQHYGVESERRALARRAGILSMISMLVVSLGCGPADDHSTARNVEVVQVVFSEIWSKGKVDLVDELYAADFVGHFPGKTYYGPEDIRNHVIAHRNAFPDWTEEIEETIAEKDRVVVRFRSSGTNRGKFLDNEPTGNRVEISEVAIFRLRDGKIVEQWVYPDILSMQRQLRGEGQR